MKPIVIAAACLAIGTTIGTTIGAGGARAQAAPPESCEATLAATRNFRNGMPANVTPLPDGTSAIYLRSGPRDTVQALYRFDIATGVERSLAQPRDLEAGTPAHLSVEEHARRERARITATGLTDYTLAQDGHVAIAGLGGRLFAIDTRTGNRTALPSTGWLTPHLSPDGHAVAAVRDDDLHVIDLNANTDLALPPRGTDLALPPRGTDLALPPRGTDLAITTGGTETVTHGLAEFAAEEELDRLDGFWWSPDSARLLYETADMSGVEKHYIADPAHPDHAPVGFAYPQAGTPNAVVQLGLVSRHGGATIPVDWDRTQFPYLARVVWPKKGPLSLVVLDRSQTHERVLAVDQATGATRTLLEEHDAAWVGLTPFARSPAEAALPHWLDDGSGFLWASDRSGIWQLELHHADGRFDHVVTPPGFRYSALYDVSPDGVVVGGAAVADRIDEGLYRVALAGGTPTPLATASGLHAASFGEGHGLFADHEDLADGTARTTLRDAHGAIRATVPSASDAPHSLPNVTWTRAGPDRFDAVVLHPHGWHPGGPKLPVVLAVYAGPLFKEIRAASRLYLDDQCIADHGAVVVALDGRGTPGRGHDWERATKYDLIDKPLDDQVAGLQALGRAHPEMDMHRVAVMGWSFGGYFTAMATARRPDVFAAGIAGAPVVDFADYDTAYTERFLGMPQDHANAYRTSNVLTYAGGLARPLMIVQGLTDDNVYFVNSFKLTQALLAAGKPYRLLLLPGTHMLADPKLRAGEATETLGFLHDQIGVSR